MRGFLPTLRPCLYCAVLYHLVIGQGLLCWPRLFNSYTILLLTPPHCMFLLYPSDDVLYDASVAVCVLRKISPVMLILCWERKYDNGFTVWHVSTFGPLDQFSPNLV